MMRILVVFLVIVAVALCDDFERKIKRLSELNRRDLPQEVVEISRRNVGGHFCCKKKPIEIVQVSRAASRVKVVKEKVKVGVEPCGFLGYSSCSVYDFEYKKVTYYEAEYQPMPKTGDCPKQNITCCNGYFYIKGLGRCVALKDLKEVIKAIEKAKEMEKAQESSQQ